MVSLQIEIPDEFLKEEVRQGYTVTEKMKKVWAVQLDRPDLLHFFRDGVSLTHFFFQELIRYFNL